MADVQTNPNTSSAPGAESANVQARAGRSGYVYVLQHGDTQHYKIGKAKVWALRVIKQIRPVMPLPVTVAYAFATEDCQRDESYLHQRLQSKRLNGEWFALDADDLCFIRWQCKYSGFSIAPDGTFLPDPLRVEDES